MFSFSRFNQTLESIMHVPFRSRNPVALGLTFLIGATTLCAPQLTANPLASLGFALPDTASVASPPPPLGRVRLDLTPQTANPQGLPNAGGLPDDPHVESHNGQHHVAAWGRYNRVEGVAAFASLARKLTFEDYIPAYSAALGIAFAADRGQYHLTVEQPVAPRSKVTLGVEGYRDFLPFFYEEEVLSSGENTASAFLLHKDYWDWFEAEGLRGFVTVYPSPFFDIQLGFVGQDESSLENNTDWSLFNQTDDFVENPAISEGQFQAFQLRMTYDSRPKDWNRKIRPRSSWGGVEYWLRAGWERAGGGLGGDFDLWRLIGDFRTYFRVSTKQSISTRIYAGTGENQDSTLPPQRRFALGGLGTLRGHNYRSIEGDNVALANLEYSFALGRRGRANALVFLDSGVAWDERSLVDQFIPVDIGTGIRAGDITVLIATSVNRSDTGAKVFVRFQESF